MNPNIPTSPTKPHILDDIKTKEENDQVFSFNTDSVVLLNIPGGKPNRKGEKPKRVLQPAQKGGTCFYYAVKISAICEKNYVNLQKDKYRKLASEYRKSYSKLSLYEEIRFLLLEQIKQIKNVHTLSKLELISYFQAAFNNILFIPYQESLTDFFQKFKNNSEKNIEKFLEIFMAEKRCLLSIDFLMKIGLHAKKELEKFIKVIQEKSSITGTLQLLPQLQKNIDSIPLEYKDALFSKICCYHVERIFNLQPTIWKPFHNIQVLFDLIQKGQSPIIFHGYFGAEFYNQSCMELKESIEGYKVYGWPKKSHKGEREQTCAGGAGAGHTIAVIGVRKNMISKEPEGWVYYVDPKDNSAPNEKRKIYKISYEQFCNHCSDGMLNERFQRGDPRLRALDFGRQRPKPN